MGSGVMMLNECKSVATRVAGSPHLSRRQQRDGVVVVRTGEPELPESLQSL